MPRPRGSVPGQTPRPPSPPRRRDRRRRRVSPHARVQGDPVVRPRRIRRVRSQPAPSPPTPRPARRSALAAERGGDLVPVPRHGTRRIGGPNGELVTSAADLERALTQLVVHYARVRTFPRLFSRASRERGLSCHFLIDADGRVYQTLDVIERAWHATSANDASVGVELAHEGAFVEGEAPSSTKTRPASSEETSTENLSRSVPSRTRSTNPSRDSPRRSSRGSL